MHSKHESNQIMSLKEYLIENRYNIGFIKNSLEEILNGAPVQVNWVNHKYKDRWFADPFILDVTEDYYIVLVEEWYDSINRGRIAKLTIDRNNLCLTDNKTILELDSHLSFPSIQRAGDKIYITPENSARGVLAKYAYDPKTNEISLIGNVCEERLTDSIFFTIEGKEMMFSTKLPDANGKELGIYTKQENGHYLLTDNYRFKDNISRMAGDLFKYKGKLYRPAQVCSKSYGDAVSLQEVFFENGKFDFKEIRRIYSPSRKYDIGFHTFNVYKNHIVVDGLGYRRPLLAHLFKFIWHLIK